VTIEAARQRAAVFQREVRDAVRYEKSLAVRALLVLAAVAVIVILRTLYFALEPVWKRSLAGAWLWRLIARGSRP